MVTASQSSAVYNPTVVATSQQVLPDRSGALVRTQLVITNTSINGTTKFTMMKGDSVVTANQGIVIAAGSAYIESTDAGYLCWQGAVQLIGSDANGTVAIVESFIGK